MPYALRLTTYDLLKTKEKKIAVIGLGYVGLPVALSFARHLSVIGFDINQERILRPLERLLNRVIMLSLNPPFTLVVPKRIVFQSLNR
jgi:UDP-N-acetyl-D-mannosaminuronate dehydrogenase